MFLSWDIICNSSVGIFSPDLGCSSKDFREDGDKDSCGPLVGLIFIPLFPKTVSEKNLGCSS